MATYLSFWAIVLGGAGIYGATQGWASPLFGLYALLGMLLLLVVALFFGVLQWLRFRRSQAPWPALTLGFLALGALGYLSYRALKSPLADVTTDTKNPPLFLSPLYTVDAKGPEGTPDPTFLWPREYDPGAAAHQLRAFPDLRPLVVSAPAESAYPAVLQALKSLPPPWTLTYEDASRFHAELSRKNPVFGFIDDVVVELRPIQAPGQSTSLSSTVELRSRARWALRGGPVLGDFTTDFGTGYRRVRYLEALLAQATQGMKPVPSAEKRGGASLDPAGLRPAFQQTADPAGTRPAPQQKGSR